MRRPWHTRLYRNKKSNIYKKTIVLVIIIEFTLDAVTTLSFYTHIFQFLAFFKEFLKAVTRNTDVLIFILVNYRKYISFLRIRSQELILPSSV